MGGRSRDRRQYGHRGHLRNGHQTVGGPPHPHPQPSRIILPDPHLSDEWCVVAQFKMLVAVHKHYSVEDWVAFCDAKPDVVPFVAASAGTSDADFQKLRVLQINPVVDLCTFSFGTCHAF